MTEQELQDSLQTARGIDVTIRNQFAQQRCGSIDRDRNRGARDNRGADRSTTEVRIDRNRGARSSLIDDATELQIGSDFDRRNKNPVIPV